MALKTIETKAIISAQDKTGATFAQVANKLRQMENQTAMSSRRIAGMTRNAARASEATTSGLIAGGRALVGAAAAYGVGRQVADSVSDWADLEAAVVRLGNTGEVSGEKVQAAIKSFRTMGPAMGATAKEVAEAAEGYVAAGIDFDTAIAATPAALKAAKASGADLNDIVKAGVAQINNMGLGVGDLNDAFDIMAKGGKLGSFELKNMAREFPAVTARAKSLGLQGKEGLRQLTAMLEINQKMAPSGEQAANNLNNFLTKITSADTTKRFKAMGVNIEKELKHGLSKGFNYVETTLKLVEKLTGGDEFKIAKLFPDQQAVIGIKSILDNMGEYKRILGELRTNSRGVIDRDFAHNAETARFKIDKLAASVDALKTKIGEKIGAPALQPLVDWANDTFDAADRVLSDPDKSRTEIENKVRDWQAEKQRTFMGRLLFKAPGPQIPQSERALAAEDAALARIAQLQANVRNIEQRLAGSVPGALQANGRQALADANAELDAVLTRVEALQKLRTEMTSLSAEGEQVAAVLRRVSGLGINQVPPMGTPEPVAGRWSFPMSAGSPRRMPWRGRGANPGQSPWLDVPAGMNPSLQPSLQNQTVSLDPSSKATVQVEVTVKAGDPLVQAFKSAERAASQGNIDATIGPGSIGKTTVGGEQ